MNYAESGHVTVVPGGAGGPAGDRAPEEKDRGAGSATLGGNSTSATVKKARDAIARAVARLQAKAQKAG